MKLWQPMRTGAGASVVVHLTALALLILFSEVHPFGAVTAEPIAVDIVTPEEVPTKEPEPKPDFTLPDPLSFKPDGASSSTPAATEPPPKAAPPPQQAASQQPASQKEAPQKEVSQKQDAQKAAEQKQAALQPAQPDQQQAAQQTAQQTQTAPAQLPPASMQIAAPIPQASDLTVKYGVILGLPQDRPGNGFDALATTKADVGKNAVAEFYRHVKSCSKLPSSISSADQIRIKLRIVMEPDGNLAADPVFIEGSPSIKGPALMQSAIQAIKACQPYDMLPADKYAEWKVLDLNFTPQDF